MAEDTPNTPQAAAASGIAGGGSPAPVTVPDSAPTTPATPTGIPGPGKAPMAGGQKQDPMDPVYTGIGRLYHSVLDVLGGKSDTQISYDPDTGQRKVEKVPRKPGQQWATILAGALTGLAAGSKEHGPGAGLKAAGAGFEAAEGKAVKRNEKKEQIAEEEAKQIREARQSKASLAMSNASLVKTLHENSRASAGFIEEANKSQQEVQDMLSKQGGIQVMGPGNGGTFSQAPDLHAIASTPEGKQAIKAHAGGQLVVRPVIQEEKDQDGQPTGNIKTSYMAVIMPTEWGDQRNQQPVDIYKSNPKFDPSKPVGADNQMFQTVTVLPGGISNRDMETNREWKISSQVGYESKQTEMAEQTAKAKQAGAEAGKATAEAGKLRAETALTEAQINNLKKLGFTPPPDFQMAPNAKDMRPEELQKDLTSKGVQVPYFDALYGIGHYDLDLADATKGLRKGAPQLDELTVAGLIRKYINPEYDQKNYDAVKTMQKSFANPQLPAAGGQLIAFNTAASHLGLLVQAGQALQNGNVQLANRLKNEFNTQFGSESPIVFDAIRNALVGELGKTFKGAAPDVQEMKEIQKTIMDSASPGQLMGFAKAAAELMNSKAKALDFQYTSLKGGGAHPANLYSPEALAVYNKLGIPTTGGGIITVTVDGKLYQFKSQREADAAKAAAKQANPNARIQ